MEYNLNIQITEHDKKYWQYEYSVVYDYIIPLLQQWEVNCNGLQMLDVGCGDGGGVSAMYDAGMMCKGFDIEERRVELANAMRGERTFQMIVGDIYKTPVPLANEQFDIVVLHDVFEHLEHKPKVLQVLKNYLKPNGKLLITFPPYYSAFGAHQQFLSSKLGRVPFIHHVPFFLSTILPKMSKEHHPFIEEIQKVARMKMGLKKFETLVKDAGLSVSKKQQYIIGPNHIRFGLKPMSAGIFGEIPILREFVTSGVLYLISK